MNTILKEAKRLHDLGWAVHWIKPKSKAPVKTGWSGPVRDTWDQLSRDYRKGYGLGVRLGEASKIGNAFLANIDIDLKSPHPKHRGEALAVVAKHFPGLKSSGCPTVKTGYGLRLFVATAEPLASGKVAASGEEVRVMMPTSEVGTRQRQLLTPKELAAGWRVRPAWEVEFMSSGKQVVLPPSIHPDTGEPYTWAEGWAGQTLPLVAFAGGGKGSGAPRGGKGSTELKFEPVAVDLVGSTLSDRIVEMLLTGEGVSDRSAACYAVALAMTRAKFTDAEIMTVLTDRTTVLGETAYEHRHTTSRAAAAQWVLDYCIRKARTETDVARVFQDEVAVTLLSGEAAAEQVAELVDKGGTDWRGKLKHGKEAGSPPKPLLENTVLVLTNAVAPDIFKRDLFAMRDFYGTQAPWGGVKGEPLTDDDAINIKLWLGQHFRFEPSVGVVFEAMVAIASKNAFHPVREELEALPPWDGVARLDGWLKAHFSAKGPDEYLAQVFRKWLVASVARTFEPGLKFDWLPIFEGEQGTGKSTFGALLFGDQYFTDWLPALSDKDAALGLQGIRCVEFGELDQLRRNELETTKAFVTRVADKVRPPYGKRWLEARRQCVFFGTTNKDEYLKDDTGNRRFNPVKVGRLHFGALKRDRVQLWAEALFIYRNGLEDTLYLEGSADEFARVTQADKMVSDESTFMVEEIRKFRASDLEGGFDFQKFKITTLFDPHFGPLRRWKEDMRHLQFAAKALKLLGAIKWKSDGHQFWKML